VLFRSSRPLNDVHKELTYRPEVDGLRALAVLAVVLFHARVLGFTGGYVGVDIFFVISGYLITSIIAREAAIGTFSIVSFYERRLRRILPALAVVTFFVVVAAFPIYMPFDFKELGQSVVALALFSSNNFFWLKSGYFSPAAELRPLLHTWSLGVEEQFYIFWPIMVVFLLKLDGRYRKLVIWPLFVTSLATSQLLLGDHRDASFYLIFSRTWELLLGSLLALKLVRFTPRFEALSIGGGVGLSLIFFSICFYSESTPFPGLRALLPCVGSCLVIESGEEKANLVARLLSARPLVLIGLISYSLYLWHWPFLAFARYLLEQELTIVQTLTCCLMAVSMAILSYRYIETPVRKKQVFPAAVIFLGSACFILVAIIFGAAAHVEGGFPGRLPHEVVRLARSAADINPMREACDRKTAYDVKAGRSCALGMVKSSETTWALWGDSFADALMPGFDAAGKIAGQRGVALVQSGCYPLPSVMQMSADCELVSNANLAFLEEHHEIRTVVLVARWTSAVTGVRLGTFSKSGLWLTDATSKAIGATENRKVTLRGVERIVDRLPGRRIVVVAHIPEQRVDAPRVLALDLLLGRNLERGELRADYDGRREKVQSVLTDITESGRRLEVLDLGTTLCDHVRCPLLENGIVRFVDDNHLSATLAISLAPQFAKALVDIGQTR